MSSTLSCDSRKICLLPESGFSPVMKNDPYLCLHTYISGAHKGLTVPLNSLKKKTRKEAASFPQSLKPTECGSVETALSV